ncbi:23S rRNA (uracil(1939)-C(5))-methyltransferase RlmD [Pelistega europaea]|uniref:23S rRNA (uracil(1939)-C(5))-methyltransferase RlmD n=1 Tax=Pelistega europaea TaxID=106147 RepID=A0A7Y4L9V9_9BURK|nr:23S rRNA (uracil(1939)-C(5))-methyltransferase RlmD [Pelistega europaea]NOL49640.1 23S rRNA (uracil(1939)-C(5))-methyltransferase RlmD [Pelistega europaea]
MSEILSIESLDNEARGIARRDGKVVFVEGALPGELVEANVYRKKSSFDNAHTMRILKQSFMRVEPQCPNYGVCGGCAMQHLEPSAQVAVKQRTLEDNFKHIAGLKIPQVLPAIYGPTWGYRFRARLSVRYVRKKDAVLIGFREKRGHYVVDMTECLVLPKIVSDLLAPMRELIGSLTIKEDVPQIEVAVGDSCVVLALRHMEPLIAEDIALLEQFAAQHNVVWWTQAKGPDTLKPLNPADENRLAYALPQFGLRMHYKPSDFTQVNYFINRSLIAKALSLLAVEPTDRVADLFCGLGNFTLPLATQAQEVVGIEGSSALTDRALAAAAEHGLNHKTSFSTLNLFEVDVQWLRDLGYFDRMLIDPPREGAFAVAKALAQLTENERPKRIVYVSCNPATLARDAGVLVKQGGYRLVCAGVVNMFPHTAHVESIAVFEWHEGDVIPVTSPEA